MAKNTKRFLSWLVAASLTLSLAPAALAVEPETSKDTADKAATAESAANEAKGAANNFADLTKEGTLIDQVNDAYEEYQAAYNEATKPLEEEKSAADKVTAANEEIQQIVTDTNTEIGVINNTANDALQKAVDTIEAATDENGLFTDVEAAKTAADAAAQAADAAAAVVESEEATIEEKREAVNTANEAVTTANEAVERAQNTVDAAQADVDAAQAAYEKALADYTSLVGDAETDIQGIHAENTAANNLVMDANAALERAQAALAAAQEQKDGAQSAYEAAQAAQTLAQEKANAAQTALNNVNVDNISSGLGFNDEKFELAADGTYDTTKIDTAKNSQINTAKDGFDTAVSGTALAEYKDLFTEDFTNMRNRDYAVEDMRNMQLELAAKQQLRKEREEALKEALKDTDSQWKPGDGMPDWSDLIHAGEQLQRITELARLYQEADMQYRDSAKDAAQKLFPAGNFISFITNKLAGALDPNTIKEMVDAKTDLEVKKVSASNYAAAANALVAAKQAKKAADDAKIRADQALLDYEAARTALSNAQALAELQTASFHQLQLDTLKAEYDLAVEKLNQANIDLEEAKQAADDAQGVVDDLIDQLPSGDTGDTGDTGTTTGGGDGDTGTTIEDGIVPLALMPTRGELMNYLYVRSGSPAAEAPTFTDVPADHEFATAIGWAQQNGIATGYADGTFDPDNFVIAVDMTAFLTRYAQFAGMTMPTLTSMANLADDDIVENADEILSEFFGD